MPTRSQANHSPWQLVLASFFYFIFSYTLGAKLVHNGLILVNQIKLRLCKSIGFIQRHKRLTMSQQLTTKLYMHLRTQLRYSYLFRVSFANLFFSVSTKIMIAHLSDHAFFICSCSSCNFPFLKFRPTFRSNTTSIPGQQGSRNPGGYIPQ